MHQSTAATILSDSSESYPIAPRPVALQRCDMFVGTMNWLYDHLRFVPRHTPLILCDRLSRRDELPELETWLRDRMIFRALWRRVAGAHLYPPERRRISRRAPAVLHSHFGYVAVEDLPLQRSLEIPWIVGFYGADVYCLGRQPQWRERYTKVFTDCSRALALGPRMADGLAALGCPLEKIRVHPLGVDVQTIPHAPREFKPGDTLRVLFAGTFIEKKGLRDVVQAVGLARDAGLRLELHIAGDRGGRPDQWGLKDEIFGLIARLGLEDCVRHHSWLSFKELLALALKCHVFVAPSVTASDGDAEGTPFVLQQMMATAMPAIATLHSDIPYIFGEHASLLLPEHDVRGIADRLQRYHDVPETMIREGLALRDRIGNAFDVNACAARLSDVYDEVSTDGDSVGTPCIATLAACS